MAAPTRTIRIKFDGSAAGLKRAANDAAKGIERFGNNVERQMGGFGARIGAKLNAGVNSALAALPVSPQLAGIGAGIGAAMAPALGAALVAGVLLAVGGGVLAAGIFAASKDPQVSAAWTAFGERAKKALAGFAEPFKAPMIRAADTFGAAVERMAPQIKQLGVVMAPLIDKLAPALATMFEKAMPGIAKAAEASKPLFDVLAAHAGPIGEAIGKMFEGFAKGAPGATIFLDLLFKFIETQLPTLGLMFSLLAAQFELMKGKWDLAVRGIKAGLDGIKAAAVAVRDWFVGMWDDVKNAFRAALNWIIDKWNNFHIPAVKVAGVQVSPQVDFPDLPRLQHGGPALAGRDYLVGEAGPEILRMGSQSGTVIPNHAIGGPDVLNLTLDLGHGIQQVVSINLRERDRGLKRRAMAGAGAR